MWSKSMDWFLYDNGLRHERVKGNDLKIENLAPELRNIASYHELQIICE